MRLVVWNCRQALHEKLDPLLSLRPDVAVVPECAGPAARSWSAVMEMSSLMLPAPWVGTNKDKGLGVFTFGSYRAGEPSPGLVESRYSMQVPVSGPEPFDLVAIWSQAPGYVENVHAALDAHREVLRAGRAVLAGDFNSSKRFDHKHDPNHSDLVARLADEFGMVSAYHRFFGEEQGAETRPTHRHSTRGTLFHIDFAFVPAPWAGDMVVEVGSLTEWRRFSDHFPLVVNATLPDGTR